MAGNESQISVVIPTRNRASLLAEALASVLSSRLIASPNQVIVVDDGSVDDTSVVASSFGVKYISVNVGGPSAARNAGLDLVETPYVAFLDDDDVWLAGNMEPQLAALERSPEAAFSYGRFQMTSQDLVPFGPPHPDAPLPSGRIVSFLYFYNVQLGTVLFRTAAVRDCAGFEPSIRYAEDQDLLLRLTNLRPAIGVEFTGSLFRQRTNSAAEGSYRLAGIRAHPARLRRNRRYGIQPSLFTRWRASWRFRAFWCWHVCGDAELAALEGRRRDALRYLIAALELSPPHALLRNPAFWGAVVKLPQRRRVGSY